MDTLCGIGLPELIIVALVGFVVVGPERSRDLALQLGRWLSKAMRSPWWREFSQITQSLRDLPTTLVRMAELEEAQADIRRTLKDIDKETRIDLNERLEGVRKSGEQPEPQEPSTVSDPWGIRNAAAGTAIHRPDPAPPDEDDLAKPPDAAAGEQL